LLEAVFDARGRVREGSDPDAVTRIQQALVDVVTITGKQYDLGRTGPAANGVDGVFGPRTSAAVRAFKADEGLGSTTFGDVGPGTMARLDGLFSGAGPTPAPCIDGPVSLEPDPIPDVPPPAVAQMPADQLLALIRKRQVPGSFVPPHPPLGAAIPRIDGIAPIVTRAVPDDVGCLRCVAEWSIPKPVVEIFLASGSFSDEKRFWVTQPGDNRECPTPVPTLKEVRKVILPSARPTLLLAELEHFADFRRAFRMAIHRWSSTVGRLSEARTHLRARTADECVGKVSLFLNQQTGLPVGLPITLLPAEVFAGDVMDLYSQTSKRDAAAHIAESNPPRARDPIRPTIDLARNPFGCSAFLRYFDHRCGAGRIPGPSADDVVTDLGSPPKQRWHAL
jgi:peptidoglycan hydrolase-like protein with peptidoglycan-binding domain